MESMIGKKLVWNGPDGFMNKGEVIKICSWDSRYTPCRMIVSNRHGNVIGGLDCWFEYGEPFREVRDKR